MADNKEIFAIIGLAVFGIIMLAYFSGAGVGGAGGGSRQTGETIACEVLLDNTLIDPKIKSVSCQRDNCGLFDTVSVFGSEGKVRMKVNGVIVDTETYDIPAFSTGNRLVELKSSCVLKGSTATIEVIKDDGKLLDSRSGL